MDFWKLDRDVFFELTYQVLQLRMEINRSEAIGSFSESSPNFDAGAGVSEPRFCGFDQEGDFWSKNKYHQSIRNWILRLERSSDLQILYFDFLILHHSSNDFWTKIRFKIKTEFWKLIRSIVFDPICHLKQLQVWYDRSEAIESFLGAPPNFSKLQCWNWHFWTFPWQDTCELEAVSLELLVGWYIF